MKKRIYSGLLGSLNEAIAMERAEIKGHETKRTGSCSASKWTKIQIRIFGSEVLNILRVFNITAKELHMRSKKDIKKIEGVLKKVRKKIGYDFPKLRALLEKYRAKK